MPWLESRFQVPEESGLTVGWGRPGQGCRGAAAAGIRGCGAATDV